MSAGLQTGWDRLIRELDRLQSGELERDGRRMTIHAPVAGDVGAVFRIIILPRQLRRSLAWDQGAEMARHAELRILADLPVYFCDPHSPWQRGTNENTNGLLRQYFPKETDLSLHGPDEFESIAAGLNGRPRKTLGWRTPAEALDELLRAAQTASVATTG